MDGVVLMTCKFVGVIDMRGEDQVQVRRATRILSSRSKWESRIETEDMKSYLRGSLCPHEALLFLRFQMIEKLEVKPHARLAKIGRGRSQ